MHNPGNVSVDAIMLLGLMDEVCEKLGLRLRDYATPEDLFEAVFSRTSINILTKLDEKMGDEFLQDDLLGIMHRAVRARIRKVSPESVESGRSA
ncbi:hypothetical protein [Brevibacillus brevis]|uniref:hypothetical protein n=2 Tax=Brevibacillus brevis TaxID=1393 RepID=UPI000D1072BD|nr:hypothetical protein [Brevibacillus brevis]PSJ66646.1 hypothetical protein C7J99_24345 [Brevibacillus brevis]RED21055.1 hypothetical protein DES34_1233 [Brevibacillus brevis]GEC93918.1 hypothetical protein BBR01nite_62490 [Brevibacillus brevis]VEF86609.1 Uncharacterised protein [Brevibacillus brevis]